MTEVISGLVALGGGSPPHAGAVVCQEPGSTRGHYSTQVCKDLTQDESEQILGGPHKTGPFSNWDAFGSR